MQKSTCIKAWALIDFAWALKTIRCQRHIPFFFSFDFDRDLWRFLRCSRDFIFFFFFFFSSSEDDDEEDSELESSPEELDPDSELKTISSPWLEYSAMQLCIYLKYSIKMQHYINTRDKQGLPI